MAEAAGTQSTESQDAVPSEGATGWSNAWQLPVLLAGVALLAFGLYTSLPEQAPDDFRGSLDDVANYLLANNPESARAGLVAIEPFIIRAPQRQRGRFNALYGDLYHQRDTSDIAPTDARNHKIIEYYTQAEEDGYPFDATHRKRWIRSLMLTKQTDASLAMVDLLESAEDRASMVRDMVELLTSSPSLAEGETNRLNRLLMRFHEEIRLDPDAARRRAAQIWASALRAKLMIEVGRITDAIDQLHPTLARLGRAGDEDLQPLMIKLAQAYQADGRNHDAVRWFRAARRRLEANDPLNAEILVGMGQITLAERPDDVEAARALFGQAAQQFPATDAWYHALVGLGDCEARLNYHDEAGKRFAAAADHLFERSLGSGDRDFLERTIWMHFELTAAHKLWDSALDYLSLIRRVEGDSPTPKLLAAEGMAREATGLDRLETVARAQRPENAGSMSEAAIRQANQEAAAFFEQAAQSYYLHSQAVVLADDQAYADSLWKAAENYDRGQLWDMAIDAYSEFVRNRVTDPQRFEAQHRLGMAFLAKDQHETARAVFQKLIDDAPRSSAAYDSLVPLAKCHAQLNDIAGAAQILEHVIQGHPSITPEARQYRDAMVELGRLRHEQGRFKEAIEVLETAVARYGRTEVAAVLEYRLAEAYRRSVDELDILLSEPMPPSRKASIKSDRDARLHRSIELYSRTIAAIEAGPRRELPPMQREYRRNAYFYRGDAAYRLADYERAIAYYDRAASEFETDPTSLFALMQIVNANCELGDRQKARVYNDKALRQLEKIPDSALNDMTTPMTREHWENWLRWSSEMDLFGASGSSRSTAQSASANP